MATLTKTRVTAGRDVYTPKESFSCDIDGVPAFFNPNKTFVREGHPILTGPYGHLFVPVRVQYDVEAATSAPGEVRG